MATISSFDPGKFRQDAKKYTHVWLAAQKILEAAIHDVLPDKKYTLRVHDQMRWQGNHLVTWKVSRYDTALNSVILTAKPEGHGNQASFVYSLTGQFDGWDSRRAYFALRDYHDQLMYAATPEITAQVVSNGLADHVAAVKEAKAAPVEAATAKTVESAATALFAAGLPLSQKIAQWEEVAFRTSVHEEKIGIVQADIDNYNEEIRELQAKIDEITAKRDAKETEVLKLMDQIESDEESHAARTALEQFTKMMQRLQIA